MIFPAVLHTFLIGVVCGFRSMTGPAAVSWAAYLGWLDLSRTPLAFVGLPATAYILTLLAIGEWIVDKLPGTPSRKAPPSFITRVVLGSFSAYALSLGIGQSGPTGAVLGAIGAVAGTIGGYEARMRAVGAAGIPAFAIAVLEDASAIALGLFIVHHSQRI